MTYIETKHAPELKAIRTQIQQKDYISALAGLKNLQSGIDWNWIDDETGESKPYEHWSDQEKLDGELYSITNSLHMAKACGPNDTHFAKRAILEIETLIGKPGASESLNILNTTAAIAAEKELEQWDATRKDGGKN